MSLESLALRKGISKAEIIRLSLDKYLSALPVEEDPALGIMGLGRSGKKDMSERHDAYIVEYAAACPKRTAAVFDKKKRG